MNTTHDDNASTWRDLADQPTVLRLVRERLATGGSGGGPAMNGVTGGTFIAHFVPGTDGTATGGPGGEGG
jgi:hypothetical protein